MINSGKKEAPALVRRLSRRSDVRLTVTVGRDVSLRREIEVEAKSPAHPVDILGWTTKMPELLTSHHVIITKAGGATVPEAIARSNSGNYQPGCSRTRGRKCQANSENDCGRLAPDPDSIVGSSGRCVLPMATPS